MSTDSHAQIHAAAGRRRSRSIPDSAPLNAMLGFMHFSDARHGWTGEDARNRDEEGGRPTSSGRWRSTLKTLTPIVALSGILLLKSRFEEAAAAARKAVKLGPSLPMCWFSGACLCLLRSRRRGDQPDREGFGAEPKLSMRLVSRRAGQRLPAFWPFRGGQCSFPAYHARNPGFGLADIVMIQEQAGRLEEARQTATQLLAGAANLHCHLMARTQFRVDTEQMAADVASLRASGSPGAIARQLITHVVRRWARHGPFSSFW